MPADRDRFKGTFYVVHKFNRYRSGRRQICERCGVKRRHRSSGWEWQRPGHRWVSNNPLCTRKPTP